MPNRVRPRCPDCDAAMLPLFRRGARGKAFVRVQDSFHCPTDGHLARGRRKTRYLD